MDWDTVLNILVILVTTVAAEVLVAYITPHLPGLARRKPERVDEMDLRDQREEQPQP